MGNASKVYADFIDAAAQQGLPVAFLRTVARSSYTISEGDSDSVRPWTNSMTLSRATLSSVGTAWKISGQAAAIGDLYHESTHAWLDLKSNDVNVARTVADGERYYRHAPLKGGARADDPGRLFQEAIGSYVGHRVSTYWIVLDRLTRADSATRGGSELAPRARSLFIATARSARSYYEQAMGLRVFGYQPPVGWFQRFSGEEVETTKMVSSAMKNFADQVLLEGKLPEQFDAKKQLADLWRRLRARFSPHL